MPMLPPQQYQADMPSTSSTVPTADLSELDARRAYYTGILPQVAYWEKLAEEQKLTALVELSNVDEDEKTLQLAIQLSIEYVDLMLLQQMHDIIHNKMLITLEQSAQFFELWLRKQSVQAWGEAKKKKEEEADQLVMDTLAEEIGQLVQESQRAVIIYQPPYVQATPLQQVELQVPHSSPTVVSHSSSNAPELTTTDVQQMIDSRIQSLEAKFEERLSLVEEQAESNYAKLIVALKMGERRQKKKVKKARKKEDKARRQAFEEQLKLMQEMAANSRTKKDDPEKKKES